MVKIKPVVFQGSFWETGYGAAESCPLLGCWVVSLTWLQNQWVMGEAKECQRVGDFDKGYKDSPGPREGGNRAAVGRTQRYVVLYTYTHADLCT